MDRRQVSPQGLELTWATNVLAPFLLTVLLLDAVTHRVVTTASISAASDVDWGNLQQERGFSPHGAYALSKLCNIMFSSQLASRLAAAGSALTSNSLDPGTVNTKMLLAGWGPIGMRLQASVGSGTSGGEGGAECAGCCGCNPCARALRHAF